MGLSHRCSVQRGSGVAGASKGRAEGRREGGKEGRREGGLLVLQLSRGGRWIGVGLSLVVKFKPPGVFTRVFSMR